ncbi:hypothetical protein AVEN_175700-1 [Araneus ventricosus]|uniref:Uncharacterized protein n=1 Tax=Araneus ventricosus TaxID=182803 RepID=A0A4Y2LE64_ARAVE|nr:hypothetical protein AVEN_175700-1 [Araneus ventricosus]
MGMDGGVQSEVRGLFPPRSILMVQALDERCLRDIAEDSRFIPNLLIPRRAPALHIGVPCIFSQIGAFWRPIFELIKNTLRFNYRQGRR